MNGMERFAVSNGFERVEFEGEVLLMPVDTDSIEESCLFSLEGIGGDVLTCIYENMSLSEMIDHIAASYNEEKDIIANDVQEFVEELISSGIVTVLEE